MKSPQSSFLWLCFVVFLFNICQGLEVTQLGIPSNSSVACFGDFNSDKHTDIFTLRNENGSTYLEVYLWNEDAKLFMKSPAQIKFSHNLPITNVVASDFNVDGKLDLLVSGTDNIYTTLTVYLGYITHFSPGTKISPSALDQVLIMNYNNDRRPDLFGVSAKTNKRTFWINKHNSKWITKEQELLASDNFTGLAIPHSNAFVDLNGDCLSDLWVIAQNPHTKQRRFELWINKKHGNFKLVSSTVIGPEIGQVTFTDFNMDGTIDLIFPVCEPRGSCENSSLHIFYNKQIEMCSSSWKSMEGCRPQKKLCTADNKFTFGNFSDLKTPSDTHLIIPPESFYPYRLFVPERDSIFSYPPLTIRTGDINIDGYEDLLIPLIDDKNVSFLSLWQNDICPNTDDCLANQRFFTRRTKGTDDLEKIKGAYAGAMFDISDNGLLDIIVLSVDTSDQMPLTTGLINDFDEDAFFFTVQGSNGVCPAWCSTGEKFPSHKPYGVNQHGTSIKFTITDISGDKRVRQGAQMSQSAYLSLQTPYKLFGLGRTNSYIDEFFAGFPITGNAEHWFSWVTLIPNAQIFVFPYEREKPSTWTLELFLNPSERLIAVSIALGGTIFLLAIVIGVLHSREKKQEQIEKRQGESLLYTF